MTGGNKPWMVVCRNLNYPNGSRLSHSSGKNKSGEIAPNVFGKVEPGVEIDSNDNTQSGKGYYQTEKSFLFSCFKNHVMSLVFFSTVGNGWDNSTKRTHQNRTVSDDALVLIYIIIVS